MAGTVMVRTRKVSSRMPAADDEAALDHGTDAGEQQTPHGGREDQAGRGDDAAGRRQRMMPYRMPCGDLSRMRETNSML